MNFLEEHPLASALGIGALVFIGYNVHKNDQEEKKKKLQRKERRTRTRVGVPSSRDSVAPKFLVSKTDEKVSSPNLSATMDSTKTRSSGTNSVLSSRTSSFSFISTIPSNGTLGSNKYPIHYYSLSKKAKWKFRKRLQQSLQSVI